MVISQSLGVFNRISTKISVCKYALMENYIIQINVLLKYILTLPFASLFILLHSMAAVVHYN